MNIDDRVPRTRSRTRKRSTDTAIFDVYLNGIRLVHTVAESNVSFALFEQITDYPRPKPGSKSIKDGKARLTKDRGGPMFLQRHMCEWFPSRYHYATSLSPQRKVTQGMFIDPYVFAQYDVRQRQPLPADTSNMDFYAAKAWNALVPTKRPWDFLQFLIEFRDTPHLFGTALRHSNEGALLALADEYLNLKFGWESLVADLTDFVGTFKKLCKHYEFLVKNNGLPVRRKTRIYHDVQNTVKNDYPKGQYLLGKYHIDLYPGFASDSETRVDSTRIEESYYASGKMVYHLPSLSSDTDKLLAALDYSLGVTLRMSSRDLHTLWKVWPWSWLLDWFGNLGTLIENSTLIHEDSVFAEYAYVTYHKTEVTTIAAFGPWGRGEKRTTKEVIRRDQATPYGFGVKLDNLSTTRKLILLAAGAATFLRA